MARGYTSMQARSLEKTILVVLPFTGPLSYSEDAIVMTTRSTVKARVVGGGERW